jgi:hypothetical protein
MVAYGRIKQGVRQETKSNTGRKQININGALNIEVMDVVPSFDETINAQSTPRLLRKLEAKHPNAKIVHMICDHVPY